MISKKKKRKKRSNLPFILIFLVGLSILVYPQISMWYYRIESNSVIKVFDEEKDKLTDEDVKKRIELAKQYNSSLNNVVNDPYDDVQKAQGKQEYARMLQIKEYIGHIQIPKINEDIPMYAGTTEEVLQKGAGHLEGTSLPIGGPSTHTVITAHTGLPTAKLFTALEKNIEVGDKFYIHNLADTLAYEVEQIKIVLPTEFNDLLVVPDKDYATLLTCTPYMVNSHRLLVRGKRIPYVKEEAEKEIKSGNDKYLYRYAIYAIGLLVAILLYLLYKRRKKRKKLGVDNGNR